MAKEEITPSEWQIMEVLWACGNPLTYCSGGGTNAMAALPQSFEPTDEPIRELEEVLEKCRDRGTKFRDKEGGCYD